MTTDTRNSIDACAAHYGEDAEAMREYLIRGEQEALAFRILPDRADEVTRADAAVAGEEAPGGTVVVRPEDVGREVVLPVSVDGDESAPRRVRRQLDGAHRP